MTIQRMIELLQIEHECMLRVAHDDCDRNCADCELVQDDGDLHEMYANVISMLKEQEPVEPKASEWLEDSDPGQEYGTTWACRKCMHSIHKPYIWNPYDSGYKYCFHCGARMEVKLDAAD